VISRARGVAETERTLMGDVQTNLRVFKASRKKPQRGDIFAMQLPDESYLFGRVIGADLAPPRAPMPLSYPISAAKPPRTTAGMPGVENRSLSGAGRRASLTLCTS